jgi:hypothetical protein
VIGARIGCGLDRSTGGGWKVLIMKRVNVLGWVKVLGVLASVGAAVGGAAPSAWAQVPKKMETPRSEPFTPGPGLRTPQDLPVQNYIVPKKPSELFDDDAAMTTLMAQIKADAEKDLREQQFGDPRLPRMLHGVLASIALLENDLDKAQGHYDQMRELDIIASSKPLNGLVMMSAARAMLGAGMDAAKAEPAFEADFRAKMDELDWNVVGAQVTNDRKSARLLSEQFIRERLPMAFDPKWDAKTGQLGLQFAHGLVGMRASLRFMVPMTNAAIRVYDDLYTRHESPLPDIWSERQVTLTGQEGGSPVLVAAWNWGIDAAALGSQAWTNPGEQANGRDDDGDGFIDNLHGLAWTQDWKPTTQLLMPTIDARCEPALLARMSVGYFDDFGEVFLTDERFQMKKLFQRLMPAQRDALERDMRLMMLRAQGTHQASVILEGNPYAKVQGVRFGSEDFWRQAQPPTDEASSRAAQAIRDAADLARKSGARVVHIGWQLSVNDLVAMLEAHGIGEREVDRRMMASPMLRPMREALEEVMKANPEILFVGGLDSTRQGETNVNDAIPTRFTLPNFLLINNVSADGLPNKFTSKVPYVNLFAKGRDVEGALPGDIMGGMRTGMSGPHVASAQGANLAAKLIALNPSLTPAQVIELITKGGHQLPRNQPGMLMIDPRRTLELAREGR